VATDDMEIVSALRLSLAGRVGKERFELWFGGRTRLDVAGHTLTVFVPNEFFKNWLCSNFRGQLESACRETIGPAAKLHFRVDPGMGKPAPPSNGKPAAGQRPPASSSSRPPAAATANKVSGRRLADFDSFVEGPSNRLARAAAEMVAGQPGELSPLLIHGPTSVGKTHLLEAICTATRRRRRGIGAVYLSSERFTTDFLQALRGGGLPSFRRKYRQVDLLVIDDLQFFCGKRATQVELLYTVDALLREGRQLVFSADRAPAEMSPLGPELITRLESGMVCRVDPPGMATRRKILAQMAARMGVALSPEVAQSVASRLTNHARELSGALCRLQATSRAVGKPISLALAQEALADIIRQSNRPVRLADIDRAVCDTFGLEPKTLKSDRRGKRVSQPRMLAMWLARKYTRAALSEIGHYFGRRSHSTVISAQKRVECWLSEGTTLDLADQTCDVDDAIRRVERCLRAG